MSDMDHRLMTLDEFKALPVMAFEEVDEFSGFIILPREDHDEDSPDYKLMDLVLVAEGGDVICRVRCHSDLFIIGGIPKIINGKAQISKHMAWYAHTLDRSGLLEMFCGLPLTCSSVGGFKGTSLSYEILLK